MGPLFGAVLARALDAAWERLHRPDPFVVLEAGAGRGVLAGAVVAARPACSAALRYVAVERSVALAERAGDDLGAEPAAMVLGSVADEDDESRFIGGEGPLVTVLHEVPLGIEVHVVLANELLDNLPFRLLHRDPTGWSEVLVEADGDGPPLAEVLVEAPAGAAAAAERFAPEARPGARIPLQQAAVEWVRRSLPLIGTGRMVVIDYASTSPMLAARPWRQWVRTYRAHGPGGSPLDHPGSQDVTCEVAVDQLAAGARTPDADRSQADWLTHHGIDELVEAARFTWHERAHLGDLAAMAARSRVGEADALCDPAGLGAFRVLEWEVRR